MIASSTGEAPWRAVGLWLLWAAFVATVVAFVVWALHVLVDAPHRLGLWWVAGLIAFAFPAIAIWVLPLRRMGPPVLRATVTAGGLVTMVLAVYLIIVVGLGDDVDGSEHRVLGLSMVAGAVAVTLAGPARSRLRDLTRSTAGPVRPSASAALQSFGTRMTRSVPMEELLLQLAETLRETMAPEGAEIWTGKDGVLDRTTSVPDHGLGRIQLNKAELAAVAGARVSGTSWTSMWLPSLLDPFGSSEDTHVRVAPITHMGNLLGLIVAGRSEAAGLFEIEDDTLLADLARQVGLALHNVHLDSALQESLEELRNKNRLLQESRARIVTAADESRRNIERNLHDGAQQRLVALAVKLQLAKLKSADPEALGHILDDLGEEVGQTIEEMRELAHGIYPPLLRDAGLGEALRRAAARSTIATKADIHTDNRFDPGIEAAVYFCCLEAMQNAAKHAGSSAEVLVRLTETAHHLVFEISDDGAGFAPEVVDESHGFVNMRDRLGAYGGELSIESAPGHGTVVRGELPVGPAAVEGPGDTGRTMPSRPTLDTSSEALPGDL
jgi:signal transduction histidine kinase